jgi:glycosyltransferase involved in cell wall biosynthesis
MPTVSVVIPTLNEAVRLPPLLEALNNQVLKPDEIIVADAGSKDGTQQIAREYGARVVKGGRPGPGRNAGAKAAKSDLLFFLDADVMPRPGFLARAVGEFEDKGLVVATTAIAPLEDDATNQMIAETTNLYLQVVQGFSPHAPGFCILIRRFVHEEIGGFDEKVKLAEDHDYVQRAAKHGPFEVLSNVQVPVSMRRMEKEGITKLAFKYLWCEMYALAGKPIYSTPFEYEFGTHNDKSRKPGRHLIDIGQLREQLGHFENPISKLSTSGLERLESLVDTDWMDKMKDKLQPKWETPDLDSLQVYLRRRLELTRLTPQPLKKALRKMRGASVAPGQLDSEGITLSKTKARRARPAKAAARDN